MDFYGPLESSMRWWQKRLRLEDWDIELVLIRAFEDPDVYGKVEASRRSRVAIISIVDPRDWKPSELTTAALEDTVIHELLHLHFQASEDPDEAEELVIHALTKTLISLTR